MSSYYDWMPELGEEKVAVLDEAAYDRVLELALAMMADEGELEPTSALKEAGRQAGIPFGPAMARFVGWARTRISLDEAAA
jgi:hypothetical protein